MFINFQKIQNDLQRLFHYHGNIQLVIEKKDLLDVLVIYLEESINSNSEQIREGILENDSHLKETIVHDRNLTMNIQLVDKDKFMYSKTSGKLLRVIDRR